MAITKKTEGHLTITDLTDITDVYLQYGLALASATVTNSYTFSGTGEVGWSTTYPTWAPGYQIWIRQVRIKEGISNPEYGTPYIDTAVNQLNTRISSSETNITALQTKLKRIWINEITSGDYVAGTYAASGINGTTFVESNPQTYGYNTLLRHNALDLRYNTVKMTSLTTAALTFYIPTQDNSNNWIQGKKTIELSANALRFYNPTDGTTEQAVLDANGLILKKGGLEAGSKNTTDYIYVWSHDDATNHTININNSGNKPDWRIVAGNKFGVDKAGNLYASNATISGAINANEGYIGGWQIGTDGNKSLHNGSSNTSPTIGNSTIILSKGLTSTTSIAGSSGPQTWTIAAGTNFGVTTAGKLYATGAEISGDLTASSLKINGNNYLNDITTISSKASINAEYSVEIITSNFNPAATADYLVTLTAKVTRVDGGDTSGLTYQWFGDGNSLGAASTTATSYNVPYNTTYTTFTVEIN